jgi:hypothetical protein
MTPTMATAALVTPVNLLLSMSHLSSPRCFIYPRGSALNWYHGAHHSLDSVCSSLYFELAPGGTVAPTVRLKLDTTMLRRR